MPCSFILCLLHDIQRDRQASQRHSQPALARHAGCQRWNVTQYAVLVHLLAQVSGLLAGELVHVIADAHIYDRHVDYSRSDQSEGLYGSSLGD